MAIEIQVKKKLARDERKRLFEWQEDVFGSRPLKLQWRPKEIHIVLYEGAAPMSHVGLIAHRLQSEMGPLQLGGVGGVVTVPQAQKRGLATRTLRFAADYMRHQMQADFGFLFCLPHLVAFYKRLDWQPLSGLVLVQQPFGKISMPTAAMVLPLTVREWPLKNVDLESYPW